MGNFRPIPLDQLPIPNAAQPTEFKPAEIDRPPTPQPPGAGSMGTGGKVADIASNFLNGWLKGKQQAEQHKLAIAQQNVNGSQYAFQIAQQNSQNVMNDPNATPQAKQQAEQARQQAWKSYLDVAGQYTEPEKGAKKSGGQGGGKSGGKSQNPIQQKLQQVFGAADPHMFAQTSLALLRSGGPPPLQQLSPQDQEASMRLDREKRTEAALTHYTDTFSDPKATPEQKEAARQNYLNTAGAPESPKQTFENNLFTVAKNYQSGQPITDQQKDMLQAQGIIPQPVMPNTFMQQAQDGTMNIVSVDPKTQKSTVQPLLVKNSKGQNVPFKSPLPRNQAQEVRGVFEENMREYRTILKQAHPDWTDEQLSQAQAQAMASKEFGIKMAPRMSPAQSQTAISKALNEVYNSMLTDDEKKAADRILTRTQGIGGGGYMFRKDVAPRTGIEGWWDDIGIKTPGGMTAEEANAIDEKVRTYTKQVMRDKMGMDPDQIDALVGDTMSDDRTRLGMDPTPGSGGAPTGQGQKVSKETIQAYATQEGISYDEAAKKAKSEGYDVQQ